MEERLGLDVVEIRGERGLAEIECAARDKLDEDEKGDYSTNAARQHECPSSVRCLFQRQRCLDGSRCCSGHRPPLAMRARPWTYISRTQTLGSVSQGSPLKTETRILELSVPFDYGVGTLSGKKARLAMAGPSLGTYSSDAMRRLALLVNPSSNRVYGTSAARLALAEIELASRGALRERIEDAKVEMLGGVPYVTFALESITSNDIQVLSCLSCVLALFEIDARKLSPLELSSLSQLSDSLVTIQRYQGKTNEQFTRLLLNAAAFVSDFAADYAERRFHVFDPLCGRGTTLNQALLLGWDATGIEIDRKDVDAYAIFLERWLKDQRLKHKASFGPVRQDGRQVAKHLSVTFAATKERYARGETQRLNVWSVDTLETERFVKARSMDLLVTDAPYGVRHGSLSGDGLDRDPLSLMEAAAPCWFRVLRAGGGLALAWNARSAPREELIRSLQDAGFDVLVPHGVSALLHDVDRVIRRDVILARRP